MDSFSLVSLSLKRPEVKVKHKNRRMIRNIRNIRKILAHTCDSKGHEVGRCEWHVEGEGGHVVLCLRKLGEEGDYLEFASP